MDPLGWWRLGPRGGGDKARCSSRSVGDPSASLLGREKETKGKGRATTLDQVAVDLLPGSQIKGLTGGWHPDRA